MNEPRERIPAEENYLKELGRATYNFADLEWGVVWLTETLERGFLRSASKFTAGQIAGKFSNAVRAVSENDSDKKDLMTLAETFQELVEDRNRLMHGNPFTANGGEQRLLYEGKHGHKDWTKELIAEFSDKVALASIEANRILHGGRYTIWQNSEN